MVVEVQPSDGRDFSFRGGQRVPFPLRVVACVNAGYKEPTQPMSLFVVFQVMDPMWRVVGVHERLPVAEARSVLFSR